MLDISSKTNSLRTAQAKATLRMHPSTIDLIKRSELPKGNPLDVARVAAIQAAKITHQIIPYCHPLPIDSVKVEFEINEGSIEIIVTAKAIYKTGVEMEALTAASIAALTIYDMSKAVDDSLQIESVKLLYKTGGSSDHQLTPKPELKASVIVMSDSVASGKKEDISGKLIIERLNKEGFIIDSYSVLPDDQSQLIETIKEGIERLNVDLIIITGGTGVGPRDHTPEVLEKVIQKNIPGISEALRAYGQERNPFSMLSRSMAGIAGKTIIVSLPGSTSAVTDNLNVLFPALLHSFEIIGGSGHSVHEKQNVRV